MRDLVLLTAAVSLPGKLRKRPSLSRVLIPSRSAATGRVVKAFALVALLVASVTSNAEDSRDTNHDIFWIGLANGSEVEATMAFELRDLIRKYDVEPWALTRKILIDKTQIPHSHPVLTIHTRHVGDERLLLSTFIHEQLHWLEDDPWLDDFQTAMSDFKELFPIVPASVDGGARDKQSTYRHLLVCDMELQALTTLLGQAEAREILAQITHYQWIYEKVLNDPRVREVSLRHGFNVSQRVPKQ